jgi:hypothetical protein
VPLQEHQVQIRDLVVGSVDTGYPWYEKAPDWWSSADLATSDAQRPGSGVMGGRDRKGKLTMTGQVVILGDSLEDVGEKVDLIRAAWDASEVDLPIHYRFLGLPERLRYGRPRRCHVNLDMAPKGSVGIVSFQFEALDPLSYSAVEYVGSTAPQTPGDGITVPFTVPFTLPAATSGTVDALNVGTAKSPWTARILGPTTPGNPPLITHVESGAFLSLSANGGASVPSGQFMELDSRDRSVLLNGTDDRRQTLDNFSTWFPLTPGSNTILFQGSGTLEFRWRSAYV